MIDKKWLVLGGIAVMFFICMGTAFIPLVLGMERQVIYYPPVTSNGDAPLQSYPAMPMWGRHFGGHGFLMLPMLACAVFPLVLLAFGGLFVARRHRWAAMHAGGPGAHWWHHWHRHCYSKSHSTAEAGTVADDKAGREET
ncbi:MAG: hypothetical protein JXR84_25260 [Anaerolineae bacterium]|nr:hypothetical protein [Anaerolineae bacterium]